MSKKIKDENGNVYVQKKPFYKKVWFWLLVVIVVICAGGALGGGDGSKSSDSSLAASSKKSNDADKTISENAEFRKKFDAIKVKDYIWTKGTVSINVQFNDDKVVSKDIDGFKFARKTKMNLDGFNGIADGATYSDIVAKFGEPDGLDEMLVSGEKTVTAIWLTGTKGGTVTLQFTNDALTSKTQSGLKN